ncbi:MAG: flippase-like domain-containing protein [Flammeovirgaceae bacterium]|nr:flippase-like domain-containing protein [Flammeovirgaceae bacterium]
MKTQVLSGYQPIKGLKFLAFISLGFVLLYLAFKDRDLSEIFNQLKSANYIWAIPVFFISLFSQIIRTIRWQMLMKPLGYRPGIKNSLYALMCGYLVNYAVPRLGEVTRCALLNKSNNVPFKPLFGTVVTERAIDILCLLILILLVTIFEFSTISGYCYQIIFLPLYSHFLSSLPEITTLLAIGFITIVLLISIFFIFQKKITTNSFYHRMINFFQQILVGIASVSKVEKKWLFTLITITIWATYFLTTYLWFFAFEETKNLTLGAGLFFMVMGSIGKSLPIQGGGMGAYHYLITQAVLLYGVGEVYGNALSIIVHGFQTAFYLVLGGISFFIISLKK